MSLEDKLLFVDVETGGLDPTTAPLLQIGMLYRLNGREVSRIERMVKVTPEQWESCAPEALNVNQLTWEDTQSGADIEDVGAELAAWAIRHDIYDCVWVGQNPSFDIRFLSHYLAQYLEFVGILPPVKIVNVMDLARRLKALDSSFRPQALSGASISLALGVQQEDNVHRAMGGVLACMRNYDTLIKRLK